MKMMGQTQVLGVVGWPVAQSKSPIMQNAALHALRLSFHYAAFAVPPAKLARAVDGALALGIRGLNITIPHKERALALCEADPLALEVGAVNTLIFEDDHIRGINTDVHGFRMLMAEAGVHPGGRALVLGGGGAARAAVAGLRSTGAAEITVISRSGAPLTVGGRAVRVHPWEPLTLASAMSDCDLLVDATPRGFDPESPRLPLEELPREAVVLDLVVKRDTALTVEARARGLKAQAGAVMLLHQGAAALERWIGQPAPIDTMRGALVASLD
jgi:shikimate dehydrogenase